MNSSLDEVIGSLADKIQRQYITVMEFVCIAYHHRIVSVLYVSCYDNLCKQANKNRIK